MSKIDTLIKELQLRKKKIDYISYIADLIKNDKQATNFKEVQKEIIDLLEPVLLRLMNDIETQVTSDTPPVKQVQQQSGGLTNEETNALKILAQKTLERVNGTSQPVNNNTPYATNTTATRPPQHVSTQDKMSFAMNNRHLANKTVKVLDANNNHVASGKIVGLDAPNVVVQTDQGPAIDVPLEKIIVI